jgi:hypothetical protein
MICLCPNCGHEIQIAEPIKRETKARWESLNSGLVATLIEAVKAVHRNNENRFHLQRDLTLSKTAYNNAQKLRYFALITHAESDNKRSGEWKITRFGGAFLRGEMTIPRKVMVQDNHVIDHSMNRVHINELRDQHPEFEPRFAYVPCLMSKQANQPKLFSFQ